MLGSGSNVVIDRRDTQPGLAISYKEEAIAEVAWQDFIQLGIVILLILGLPDAKTTIRYNLYKYMCSYAR